jgi:hypothetical protein
MSSAEDRELMLEIGSAVRNRSVPLHLAVQLTPDVLRVMWDGMELQWIQDLLLLMMHPGLLPIALTAAHLVASRLNNRIAFEWMAHGDAVMAGTELPIILITGIREMDHRATAFARESAPSERWLTLKYALLAVHNYAMLRVEEPGRTPDSLAWENGQVIRMANAAIWRALDSLDRLTRASIENALRALGPPTLEEIERSVRDFA